jgi:hypothetical protein
MTIEPVRPELSLLDGRFYADDPHANFLWMREHEPVYWDEQAKVWGITGTTTCRRCRRTRRRSATASACGPTRRPSRR